MPKEWFVFYRGNRWIGRRPCRWMPRGNVLFWVLTRDLRYGMASRPFKGICRVSSWRRPGGDRGHVEQLLRRWEYPSMKKVKREDRSPVKNLAALESELFRDHLALVEHCCCLQYEDGSPRQPGWVMVRTSGAAWQVVVKDPDSACSFTVVAKTVDEAFESAALLLGCEEAPWEPDAYLAQSQARNKKK